MKQLLVVCLVLLFVIMICYPPPAAATTFSRRTFQPTSSEKYPAWSPDGSTIAFRSDSLPSGIWTIPASGGFATHVALIPDGGSYPAWSPDGSQLAYSNQAGEIWRGPSAGGTAVQLTFMLPAMTQWGPSWSPDGSTIAFSSSDNFNPWVWKVTASGGTPVVINVGVVTPSWSPDGSRIAYEKWTHSFRIAHMAPDGTDEQVLTAGPHDYHPAWSPNGNWIAFSSDRGSATGTLDIWLVSPSTGTLVQITNDPGEERYPAWSPDGTKIVFTANWTGNEELWIASDLFGGTAVTETTWGRLKVLFK